VAVTAVGNPPKDENLTTPEWIPLKGTPYEQLRLERLSGNVSEFETPFGYRYRCVKENGVKQWFSFHTNQIMKRATRARVKVCCKKFERSFGIFVDGRNGATVGVSIFPKSSGLSAQLSSQIDFCPWCGKQIQFLEEGKVESRVRPRRLDHVSVECGKPIVR
jgi:ssDNA-binding Zn-finger/Zn-ribbon topoisomerase 1